MRTGEFFTTIENLGFDYVVGFDHVAGAPRERFAGRNFAPYTVADPFMELIVTLAHGAAVTRRIELATGVLVLPQRQTVLAAKQLATLSELSGGRVRAGLGVGWNPAEFEGLGSDFERRGRRLDEQVPLIGALWSAELVTARGQSDNWRSIGIAPRPRHRIPLWFGGNAQATLRRTALWGDGFIPSRVDARTGAPPDVPALLRRLDAACDQFQRDRSEVGVEGRVPWSGLHAVDAQVGDWLAVGATHIALAGPDGAEDSLDRHLELAAECHQRARTVLAELPDTRSAKR
ncbi:TIGR03619 family F420-dependent LLM class oxidoreductase [Jatrophihabitans cynanchi]|uniref:TIGR03619 family F420-dependent LLM class oxidoreductase n=1 Tax=Jatrophihabitans cynanchi TaxID=2944128 RepID=A0ABY7K2G1_9ACTN|nr:TIGR03619 family F420-dependent LLM class oxidoreductase [Jatrophihabitans sp. SB3-54]WAX58385.1 TIGR03619 family F420-dependent LLM class oxidoreductase [Jatrophihabitans sp. SB3-54]